MFSLDQFPLPFARDSLEPYMSEKTIGFHYDKHLGGYINNLNALDAKGATLEEIVKNSDGKIFNNAAQIWNHVFFFAGLKNSGGGVPSEIASAFGDFKAEFKAAAMSVFGSGWAWLVDDGGKISIITTANADTPTRHGMRPLLTLDVWEHAYYLDYQNRRADFIDAFLDHLINWEFVLNNLKR